MELALKVHISFKTKALTSCECVSQVFFVGNDYLLNYESLKIKLNKGNADTTLIAV